MVNAQDPQASVRLRPRFGASDPLRRSHWRSLPNQLIQRFRASPPIPTSSPRIPTGSGGTVSFVGPGSDCIHGGKGSLRTFTWMHACDSWRPCSVANRGRAGSHAKEPAYERKRQKSNGPMPRGIRFGAVPRSAPAAPTVTPRPSPRGSAACRATHTSRASTYGSCRRSSSSRCAGPPRK